MVKIELEFRVYDWTTGFYMDVSSSDEIPP